MTAKDLERFLAKVKINEATRCWEWQAYCNQDGYGKFYVSGKVSYAHRVSYAHYKGEPDDLCVLHKCDAPRCCNPDHLFIGTQQDNMTDMATKERSACNLGTNNPNCKLTGEEVLEIKNLLPHLNNPDIAKRYNITITMVCNIRLGRTWSELTAITEDNMYLFKNPSPRSKLTVEEVLEIKDLLPTHKNMDIAEEYNISRPLISQIRNGHKWSRITGITKGKLDE